MPTRSENWSVSYPPTISHPRSPLQLGNDAHGSAAPNSNEPPRSSRSPQPRRQGATRPSSTLLLLPGRSAGGWRGSSSSRPAAGGRGDHGRVRFDSVVQLILVPSRRDMGDDLSQDLWWNQEDYLRFRLGAIVEDNAGLLRRPLRKKLSRRAQAARAGGAARPPDPRLAQALHSRSGGLRPVRLHFKFHSRPPSYGASPPLRVQTTKTPPPSPEKSLCADGTAAAAAEGVSGSPAESARLPRPARGERGAVVEDFDGFGSFCGLPGPIATALEC